MKWTVLLAAALCAASLAPRAYAWGHEGHEVVALIAYAYLTPTAKARVNALLASDPDNLTGRDFASRATWADAFRDSSGYRGPRYQATHSWHFIDLEIKGDPLARVRCSPGLAPGQAAYPGVADDCIVNKINQFRSELASPRTDAGERLLAFKFLLHFVGDIHQPLHAADHFDAGGACMRVRSPAAGYTNLHSYWDSTVVAAISPDPYRVAEILKARLTQSQTQTWAADANPASWANDAYAVARRTVYNQALIDACEHGRAQGTVVLSPAYEQAATNAAAVQLAKAGVRLAALLNGALR
jgi:hypothetical protein